MAVGFSLTSFRVIVITLSINNEGLPLSVLRIVKAYLKINSPGIKNCSQPLRDLFCIQKERY